MSLFFPTRKPTLPSSSVSHVSKPGNLSPVRHSNKDGLVTDRELDHEVMAELRSRGVSQHDRNIIEAAASGFRDTNGFGSKGIDFREKEKLVDALEHQRRDLGLSQTDIKRVDDALDHALEN